MEAIVGLHHTGITRFADRIENPVVEGIDHLARIDVGIEPAIRSIAILGIGFGQFGKSILGLCASPVLGQDIIRFRFCGGHFLFGGSRLVCHDQDVADIDARLVIDRAADEIQHGAAGCIGVIHYGHVARLPGFVKQPG